MQQKGIGLTVSSTLHNYNNTFQKQEFNEDLGVDLYELKYRMDDPQIGRFWQVDPLADKYPHNSTYAFSDNKVTNHVETEGLRSEYIFWKAKQELARTFQATATSLDNTFSIGSKTKVEANTPTNGNSKNTVSVENTTSVSTNSSPFMSYFIKNNTNKGYTGEHF